MTRPGTVPAAVVILGFAVAFMIAEFVDLRDRSRRFRERAGGIRPHQHGPAARWRR